tara:strand:- start:244 stop:450 length:207 start_codon:yes stop_codon:yes gene_type:complete
MEVLRDFRSLAEPAVPVSTHGASADDIRVICEEIPVMTRQLSEDPIIRQLVAQARRSQLSRRAVLAGA